MKKQVQLLATAFILIFTGCEYAEMTPRTNPRFSVAFVQEIDESGAQFAANIYDFGSEEILEYGFLYGTHFLPRPDYAEEVKQSGKPEKYFMLKADHSMVKGEFIYVVAFIKTLSGVVYSEPHRFVSKGAVGFIFEKIEYNQPIFFGDTVTVYGENLSSLISNYQVTFQNETARITDVQKNSFKFLIPDFQRFDTNGEQDVFQISLDILDKKMELSLHIPFREPAFADLPIQQIDYGGTVEIYGDYLEDPNLIVVSNSQPPESEYLNSVTIVSADPNKIVFKPNPVIAGKENFVALKIRGKMYNLGSGIFEYNPTEIDPGQHLKIGYGDRFIIKGRNFNYWAPYFHQGVLNGRAYEINYEHSDSANLSLRFVSLDFRFNRLNDFKVQTFDKLSKNSVKIELTDPDIPIMNNPIPSISLPDYLPYGNMTSFGGKGYALGNKEIFEIDILNKSMTPLRALQLGTHVLTYTFSAAHGENWYIGGGQTSNYNPINRAFFVFNMKSGEIKRLPDLPFDQWRPILVHIINDHLYLEGGIGHELGEDHKLRYKFDLNSEKWTRLPDKAVGRHTNGRTIPFHYKGKHFAIGEPNGTGDDQTGLFEFDVITETWHLSKRFPELGGRGLATDEVFVIDNKAILISTDIYLLNLETMELSQVPNLSRKEYLTCGLPRTMAFMLNRKIYIWDCNETFWEIDPERFENW